MALLRGLGEPAEGLHRVLRGIAAVDVDETELILRVGVSAFGGLRESFCAGHCDRVRIGYGLKEPCIGKGVRRIVAICIINNPRILHLMGAMESQNTEWKESWKDEYLKTICAFANTEGGTLTIGIDDNGRTIGIDNPKTLLKQLPDKIRSKLGIIPFVRLDTVEPPYTITILVQKSPTMINLDGKFYIRSGSTTQMMSGRELEIQMMEHAGHSWTDAPVPNVPVSQLSPEALQTFKNLGQKVGRLSAEETDLDPEGLLDKLDLLKDGMLTRSAILLFHPSPEKLLGPVSLKIGMFEGSELLYQDEFCGPLIFTANNVVNLLNTKYMVKPISYDGIIRIEKSPYPVPAIREAMMNAIVHNDYSSHIPIQVKVTKENLTIYNEGGLPVGWTIDKLLGQHKSLPRNPLLANVFYRAGFIESFGRGIGAIMSQFEGREEFEPVFESDSGFSISFKNETIGIPTAVPKDIGSENRIIDYLRLNKCGTYEEITCGTGLSSRQVQRLAGVLVKEGIVFKEKEGKTVVLRLSS